MAIPNEAAMYGIITTAYFALFMYRYRNGHIVTDQRAIINIMLVFMFAQPLCRILGPKNGPIVFAAACMSSIVLLPSPQQDRKDREEQHEQGNKKTISSNKTAKTKKQKKKLK